MVGRCAPAHRLLIVGIAADFRLGSFSIGFSGLRYDNAEAYSVGDALLPADNIQQVEINWTSGSVRVEAYDGEKISIKETGAENEEQKLRYLSRDGKLTIQYCKSRAFFGIFKNPEKELTLLVPAQMAEDLKTFKIDSASTKINISDIASQEFVSKPSPATANLQISKPPSSIWTPFQPIS